MNININENQYQQKQHKYPDWMTKDDIVATVGICQNKNLIKILNYNRF